MPASLSRFITSQDYRMFFIKARREFRRRGLMTAIAFYEDRFDAEDLAERLQQGRADIVLWYVPDSTARRAAPRLRDLGIPVLGISDGGLPSLRCRYEVSRANAIRAILHDWAVNGIKSVRIARADSRPSADEERLETLLMETPLDWHFVSAHSSSTEQFIANLSTRKDDAIILLGSAASFCLMRAPEAFKRMLFDCRVALVQGPVSMPWAPRIDALLDLVVIDWQAVAERLAEDILNREAFNEHEPVIFEGIAELKTPFDKFVQKI
jgi:hypothetical protein